jgi:hypothetical protein
MKKLIVAAFMMAAFSSQAYLQTFYGSIKSHAGSGGQSASITCKLSPAVCAIVDVPIGPLNQNGTFRATTFNPDGTINSEFEFLSFTSKTNSLGETVLEFKLP